MLFRPVDLPDRNTAMTRLHGAMLLALGSLLLGACRHAPPLALAPGQSAAALEGRSLASPGLQRFLSARLGRPPDPWPPASWGLRELTLVALYYRPELRVAGATAAVARAHVRRAAQRPNPSVSVLPQWVSNAASGISPWLAAAQLDWPIETAGKRGYRRAAAQERAEAAEQAVRRVQWRVRGEVHTALVGLVAADAHAALAARVRESEREELDLLERRLAQGAVSEAVVAPQRLSWVQARADQATARRRVLEARARLAAALGVPGKALADLPLAFRLDAAPEGLEALSSRDARRAALLGRSDLREALARYGAAEQDLRLELAKQVPDLHFGPAYEFDQGSNKWGITLSLELPLLNRNDGGIDEAIARRAEVAAGFEALQAQVIAQVESASAALEGSRRELEQARSLVEAQRQRRALLEAALASGAVDRLALVGAELALQRAEGLRLDAQERFQRAIAQLEQAVEPPLSLLDGEAGPDPAGGGSP